ncbi:hypothetical protein V6N11_035376 [Hibiscus sabdariffa]|uniref:Uncharacterized protein n=1 Tax=Hibiscus sabdariffa TaxID=183260 RepID=A0ABR2R0L2_9ROSI
MGVYQGSVKEAVGMRVLAKEIATTRMSYRHGLAVLRNGWRRRSMHPGVLGSLLMASRFTYGRKAHSVTLLGYGEAKLVRVPAVEQCGVMDGAALIEQSQEESVASPRKNSRSNSVVCDRGGVCSNGDTDFAFTGIRSWEGLDIVHPSVSIAEHDSLGVKVVGDCESTEKYGRVVGVNGEGAPSTAVLGLGGAAAAPVIGFSHGGVRKVKSVNTLVEALGSLAQKHVIAAARSRRGLGRSAKES